MKKVIPTNEVLGAIAVVQQALAAGDIVAANTELQILVDNICDDEEE